MKTEKTHSPIGASSMHRWGNCPGSVRLSKGIVKTSSVYAEEGTRAHDAAEYFLKNRKWPEGIDAETKEAVKVYTDYVLQKVSANHVEMMVEHAFDLSEVHPGLYGTADCVMHIKNQNLLEVIDYKHGAGISVDVEYNEQLMYYAVGALLSTKYPVSRVKITIVQPRANHSGGVVRSWEFDTIDLLDFIADLKEAAVRTEDPKASFHPGDWCRFCPAAGICPALTEKAQLVAREIFKPEMSYDPAKLSETLSWLPTIEDYIKSVREFAYSEAMQGRCPPRFKLVEKRATRKWRDLGETNKFVEVNFNPNYARDFYTAPELKSVAQLETFIGKKEFVKFDHLIVKESSGTTLVHESDKRETVKMLEAKEVFNQITE